jgi:hypothetical protein
MLPPGSPLHEPLELQQDGLQRCPQVVCNERHEVLAKVLELFQRGDSWKITTAPSFAPDSERTGAALSNAGVARPWCRSTMTSRLITGSSRNARAEQVVVGQRSAVRVLQVVGPSGIVASCDPPEHAMGRRVPQHLAFWMGREVNDAMRYVLDEGLEQLALLLLVLSRVRDRQ